MNTASSSRLALATASFLLVGMLSACAPKYYSSNSQNVPLLTEQGEGSVAATINPDGNRAEARAAYAVSPALALQANGAVYFPRDEDSTGDGGSGGLFEAGVGHYRALPNNLVFEIWALGAYGGLENHFDVNGANGGKLNANLMRLSLQPAIGYKSRFFEGAVSSRVAMLNYFNVDGTLVSDGENQQEYLRDNRMQFLIEPALTLRGGVERVKLEAQLGGSLNLTDSEFPQDDNWASLGLVFLFR